MSKKYTYEEVKIYIGNLGYELLSDNYKDNSSRLNFKDLKGYYYFDSLNHLKNGHKPNKFFPSNSYSIQNINLWLKENNLLFKLIDEIYINSQTKLTLFDNDGYYYFVSFNNFQKNLTAEKFHISNHFTIQNIKLWCKIYNKPFELIDNQKYKGNNLKLKWQCLKPECNEIFEATWNNITNNQGCGFCAGKQVGLSNCLAIKNPNLASEWHPTLNGDLTPYDVTCGSGKEVWWKCLECGHEWEVVIDQRSKIVIKVHSCPKCNINISGENSPHWKGGVTSENQKARSSLEYIEWRKEVFKRDNYTCQICGDNTGGNLNAHHIENFSENKELRFVVNNGVTMCDGCHKPNINNSFHHLFGTRNNNIDQLIQYYTDNHGDFESPFLNFIFKIYYDENINKF